MRYPLFSETPILRHPSIRRDKARAKGANGVHDDTLIGLFSWAFN